MFKNNIFIGKSFILTFLLVLVFCTNTLKTEDNKYYIILDTYENYKNARLNRAKLGSLTNAVILEKPGKKTKTTTNPQHTDRSVQMRVLIEMERLYKKEIKNSSVKIKKKKYIVQLGPESNERITKISQILTNLKYQNFEIKSLIKEKKENINIEKYVTEDIYDLDLPEVEEKKIPKIK